MSFYGYVRGTHFQPNCLVTLPGVGDFSVKSVSLLPDPCPLPNMLKKRTLIEKEKTIYAPMSGVGGIVYDKDAVYIDLGGSHSHKDSRVNSEFKPSNEYVGSIMDTELTVDQKIEESELRVFSNSAPIRSSDMAENSCASIREETVIDPETKRKRRRAVFAKETDDEKELLTLKNKQLEKELGLADDDSDEESDVEEEEDGEEQGSESGSDDDDDEDAQIDKIKKNSAKHQDMKLRIHDALSSFKKVEQSGLEEADSGRDSDDDSEGSESEDDDDSGSSDDEGKDWKNDIAQRASEAFYKRQSGTTSLRKLVYGMEDQNEEESDEDGDDNEIGGLFKVVSNQQNKKQSRTSGLDDIDTTRFTMNNLQNWNFDEIRQSIEDCFVTGKWKGDEDAEELLKLDDDDDEEVDGDFEDLETGEVHKAEGKTQADDEDAPRVVVDEAEERKKRIEKKRALKMKFDSEYDDGGNTHYDELKREAEAQTSINRSEFEGMDDHLRVQYEGYRPGMYVRVEIEKLPCELITNFDPSYPIVLGALSAGEDQIGYVKCRVKKHRWYPRILKNRDQLIMSIGWRRFQTLPIYSVQGT